MTVTAPFVLARDVTLVAVEELPAEVREQIGCTAGDFVVTRPRARSNSRVINGEAAALLERFRAPRTIVEAVIDYSRDEQLNPQEVLVEAYPLLQTLIQSKLLLPEGSGEADEIGPSLSPGQELLGYEIIQIIHVLEDVELYQVRVGDETVAALKIARRGAEQRVRESLEREAAILRHLEGTVSPRLLQTGTHGDRPYLLMAWCPGIDGEAAAGELRREAGTDGREELRLLCLRILEAYAALHARGVIHGDIHPRNVLIAADGAVKLVDFGLSQLHPAGGNQERADRGGIGFFFEPEYARAFLERQDPPQASFRGEQYGLAALLYFLITGAHYASFSLERNDMLRQIAQEGPLSFAEQGIEPWPEVEAILRRALDKDPARRFGSVADFALHWRGVAGPGGSEAVRDRTVALKRSASAKLLRELAAYVDPQNALFAQGLAAAPTCSVNFGAAGIAYALYRMATVSEDPRLLAQADIWINRALSESHRDEAFRNAELELTAETVGNVSPYHTVSGVYAVQALVSHAMGDTMTQQAAVDAFVTVAGEACDNLDLTLGRSGVLLIGSLLLDTIPDASSLTARSLLALGERVRGELAVQLRAMPPIPEGTPVQYLGVAHGWAGFLYALLRWSQSSGAPLPDVVPERLQQLARSAEPFGRGARWKWVLGNGSHPSYMPGWCNGSAGYVFLWTQAHGVLQDERYSTLAQQAAWNTWEERSGIANLCCGSGGRAYSLLNIYKHTGESHWLRKAQHLAEEAAAAARTSEYPRESLYKGELGPAVLAVDLEQPETAAMPFFEQE